MTTLEEAWGWYVATAAAALRLTHLAKYWDDLPWDAAVAWMEPLRRDNVLKVVGGTTMGKGARVIQAELDDLAVLAIFSVFEAIVRDRVESQVRPEIDNLKHAALKKAGEDVLQAVTEGSFSRVLDPFKSAATNDLVEQVNQVRKYRNWVAHGRRPDMHPGANVTPRQAYDRLAEFLRLIQPPAAIGQATPPEGPPAPNPS